MCQRAAAARQPVVGNFGRLAPGPVSADTGGNPKKPPAWMAWAPLHADLLFVV
jgi:hypothetical protein